jgi:hypothetical protein
MIGLGIVIGILLILYLSAPRVVEFIPHSGSSGVSSMTGLQLRFNRPMDSGTVESRLRIEPERRGVMYWSDQTLIFEPEQPWPSASTVTVTLLGGSRGLNRIPMLGSRSWSFQVGEASLVYLWPGDGKGDLYQVALAPNAQPQKLTDSDLGIQDYSVSADGTLLIYSAYATGGGTELHIYDMIRKEDRLA